MTDYNKLSDDKLAVLIKEGNEAAFKVVYKKYWNKLLAIAGRRMNNQAEAEEILQDIFLNLWRRRKDLKLRIGFDNYFAIALKFEIINRLAKLVRETNRNEDYAHSFTHQRSEIYERFDFELLQKQLEHTISSLPSKCQLVFRKSREQEMTNKEIADELKISEKAVEKHMTNALRILRTRFGQHLPVFLFFI